MNVLERGEATSFEPLIQFRRISNVGQVWRIHVVALSELAIGAGTWQRIRQRDTAILAYVVVKPSMPLLRPG